MLFKKLSLRRWFGLNRFWDDFYLWSECVATRAHAALMSWYTRAARFVRMERRSRPRKSTFLPAIEGLEVRLNPSGYTFTSNSSGNWESAIWTRTGSGSGSETTPMVGDTVVVQNSVTVATSGGAASTESAGSLTVNLGGTLTFLSSSALNLTTASGGSGNATFSAGTVALTSASTLNVSGTATFSGGTVDMSSGGTFDIGTNWTFNSGTFTDGIGTVDLDGSAAQTIGGSTGTTFNILTVNNSAGATVSTAATVNSTLNLTQGTLTLSSGLTLANDATIMRAKGSLSGTPTFGAAVVVEYMGTHAMTTGPELPSSVANLVIADSGGVTLGASKTVTGTLTLTNGTLTASSGLTLGNGATISLSGGKLSTAPTFGSSVNVIYSGSAALATGSELPTSSSTELNNLTIDDSGGVTLGAAATVTGTLTLTAGKFILSNTLTVANDATIGVSGGSLAQSPTFGASVNLIYTGSSAIKTGPELPTSTTVLNNLTIDDSGGVTLQANAVVNGTLYFESGNVTTGSYTLSTSSTGSVAETSGYVIGNLMEYVAAGATSQTFAVGTSSSYTPITVSFSNVTSAGSLVAGVVTGDSSSIGTSGLDSNHSVNLNWTLGVPSSGGVAFAGVYGATFTFTAGNVDSGTSASAVIAGKLDGSTWDFPSLGTQTSTSTAVSGVTAIGTTASPSTFQLAQASTSTAVTDNRSGTASYGTSVTFTATITNNTGNGTTPSGSVVFYNGGTSIGSGSALSGSGNTATSTIALSTLGAATHAITAVYTASGVCTGSTSSSHSYIVTQAPLVVTATNQSMVFGASVPSLTYTYTGLVAGDTSASFSGALTTTGSSSSNVGSYAIALNTLAATGNYFINTFNAGTLTIDQANTALTLTAAPTSSVYGESVTLTATVVAVSPGTGTPTGTVIFYDGSTTLGSGTLAVVGGNDVATFSTSAFAAGYHPTLTASSALNTNFVSSSSIASAALTVAQATPTITWSNPSAIAYGSALGATQLDASASIPGTFSYAPGPGTVLNAGSDQPLSVTFTPESPEYTANYTTATQTVAIDVTPPTPIVTDPVYNVEAGHTLAAAGTKGVNQSVLAGDDEPTGGSLTVSAVNAANGDSIAIGTLTQLPSLAWLTMQSDGDFTYTAPAGLAYADSFTVTVSSGSQSAIETVFINVSDSAPVVHAMTYSVQAGQTLNVSGTGNNALAGDFDIAGDTLTVTKVNSSTSYMGATEPLPSLAPLKMEADGDFSYLANAGSAYADEFTVTVSNGVQTALEDVFINVSDDALVAQDMTYNAFAGQTMQAQGSGSNPNVLANDVSPNGNGLVVTAINSNAVGENFQLPSTAHVTMQADGDFTYQALPGAAYTDSFTITISDGPQTTTATVFVDVSEPTLIMQNAAYTVGAGGTLQAGGTAANPSVLAGDSDPSGGTLTVADVDGVNNNFGTPYSLPGSAGALTMQTDGAFTYVAPAGSARSVQFTITVSNGPQSANATVYINVTAQPPLVQDETYNVEAGQTLTSPSSILANDSDPNGGTLTVLGVCPRIKALISKDL